MTNPLPEQLEIDDAEDEYEASIARGSQPVSELSADDAANFKELFGSDEDPANAAELFPSDCECLAPDAE